MTGLDQLIVGSFATFFVIGVFVDWINAWGPHHRGITSKNVHEFQWPPRFIYDVYWWWCEICDPVLLHNPLWIRFLSMLSPFVFCPL